MTAVVGRDRELAAIGEFLHAAHDGAHVLLLEGEAGIGKSTLWRAGVEEARRRGPAVLAAAGDRSEARLSFTALRDLVGDVFDELADELPAPQRRALAVMLLREEPAGASPSVQTIAVAFLTALRALAARSRVLLAIDDVQWLDAASAAPIAYAIRRLPSADRALVLLSRRTEDERPRPLGLDALEPDALHVLRPGPLSVGAIGHILNTRLGTAFPRSTLTRVHEVSGGNPFFALELARALGDPERPLPPGWPLPVPRTLNELLTKRLEALPEPTLAALTIASALSRPTVALVERALGREPGSQLRPAIDAQVADVDGETIRFGHPLFAAAVYGLADAERRVELHRCLAAVVSDVEERARHLALATQKPDDETALIVEEGARAAFARGAAGPAADLLGLAIEISPQVPREQVLRRKAERASYHLVARNLAEAAALLDEVVAELPPGAERADALLKLAQARWHESLDRSRELAAAALVDARGDEVMVARIESHLAQIAFARGDAAAGVEHTRAAVRAAERASSATVLSQALTQLGWVETQALVEASPGTLERALALDDGSPRPIYADPTLALGARLMYTGNLVEAREQLKRAGTLGLARGDEAVQSGALVHLTDLECRAGNWDTAARHVAELGEHHQATSGLHWVRALVAAHRGDVAEAREAAERGIDLAERAGTAFFRALNESVVGFVELSIGDVAAADRILRPLCSQAASWTREPSVLGELPNAIEALVELGNLEEAERLLSELEGRVRAVESPWSVAAAGRCRGMILAAQGDLSGALAAYEEALLVHERLPQPFDRGRTLLALGKTQRRAGQRRAARETLGQALAIFEGLGAALWAEKARVELGRIGGRAPVSGDLTPSERRIAGLVAEGKTNREVASILVVADRTVESALTQIYRKLDVRSRTELVRKLDDRR